MEEKGKILIVDDEAQALMLLDFTLRKAFEVKKASSGEEALAILNDGFEPGVIISDLMMPGMYGTEFLKRSISIVPDATRILATAHDSHNEIIKAINEAHAFMYIKKPFDNLALFQAAVVAYDKYKSIRKYKDSNRGDLQSSNDNDVIKAKQEQIEILQSEIKNGENENAALQRTIEALNEKVLELSGFTNPDDKFEQESTLALSAYIREFEHFWFNDHTSDVTQITKAICMKMRLDNQITQSAVTASLLHNIAIPMLPKHLKAVIPSDLEESEREKYFSAFEKTIKILIKISKLTPYLEIISKMWEHVDGSGYPYQFKGDEVPIQSRILLLANSYHTLVYGATSDHFHEILNSGKTSQSKAQSINRHREAIKILYRNISAYDKTALKALNDLVTDKESKQLIPSKETLEIDLNNKSIALDNNDMKSEEEDTEPTQLEISPEDVTAGMKVLTRVRATNGIVVVKGEVVLDEAKAKTIRQMFNQGLIKDKIFIEKAIT